MAVLRLKLGRLENLGPTLRDLRHAKGLAQDVAAERAGFYQSQLSTWERGVAFPTVRSLIKLLASYDCALVFEEGVDG
jgi:transcriptional regulator with XRE-family HTH domain